MKIGILGTRGIPNKYGGFEQFAQYLSVFLVEQGHEVYVYNSSLHPYKEDNWKGVHLIHKKDPENKIGTAGQFIYDLRSILDTRKRNFDIILQLGYTSSSVWNFLFRKNDIIITNMDGLEWKRTKYSDSVKKFLKYAEKLGVKHSDYLVSDAEAIRTYLLEKYKKDSVFIPYGATNFHNPNKDTLLEFKLEPHQYNLIIARLEPENSIEIIIQGHLFSKQQIPLIIIGNHKTAYGTYLKETYPSETIHYLGYVSGIEKLNDIRYYSNIYFHGHTVGGTNPSLLEAMASQTLICANDNIFNREVLNDNGLFFSNKEEVANHIDTATKKNNTEFIQKNLDRIENKYSWKAVNQQYLNLFEKALQKHTGE